MRYLSITLVGLLAVGLSGCGSDPEKLVDVSGTVTLDGKPLADAEVLFLNGNIEGYGRTDENGHFQLVNGARLGKNKVCIREFVDPTTGNPNIPQDLPEVIKADPLQVQAMQEGQGAAPGAGRPGAGESGSKIPPEISDREKTKLTFVVPEGGTDSADFKLTGR